MPSPTDEPVAEIIAPAAAPVLNPPVTEVAAPVHADQALVVPATEVTPPASAAGTVTSNEAPAPSVPENEPTLLEKHDAEAKAKTEAAKPVEVVTPAPEAAKPAEPVVAETPTLAPIDYFAKLNIPETLKVDDAMKGDVTKAFDAFRTDPNAGAQALIDLHNKTMQNYAEQLRADQYRVFNETRRNWQNEVRSDPQIGGSRFQTSMGDIAKVRDALVPEKDRPAFESFLRVTGAGDHPVFLKMLHNAARYLGEPSLPPAGAKPVPNNGRSPSETRRERLYDKSSPQP